MGSALLQDLKESQICEGGNGQKDPERRLSLKLDLARPIKLRNGGGRHSKREAACEDSEQKTGEREDEECQLGNRGTHDGEMGMK